MFLCGAWPQQIAKWKSFDTFFCKFSLCFRFWGNKKPAKNTGEIMKMKQNQCFRPLNVSSVAMLDMSGNPTVCGDDGKCREIQQVEKLFKKCGEMEIERNSCIYTSSFWASQGRKCHGGKRKAKERSCSSILCSAVWLVYRKFLN